MPSRFLASKIKLAGLSKNKIILVCVIIVTVLITLTLNGGAPDTAKNAVSSDSPNNGKYIKPKNKNEIDNLLAQIGDLHKNATESYPLVIGKITSETGDNHNNNTEQVPDITQSEQKKFKNVQTATMYASPRGRSLMYSMKVNSSASITTINQNDNKEAGETMDSLDVTSSKDKYELKAGSVIPAIMVNGINSELAGTVIAYVRASVYDSITRTYLLIPQGSKLVGKYDSNVVYAQDRLAVAWSQLIYPDGSSTKLKAIPGTDLEGYSGFYDQVDNHYFRLFGASFIMGVITGAMQYSQNNASTTTQINSSPTMGQTMSSSLGQQVGQTGMAITQKNLNAAPTITIRPNYPFNIIVTSNLQLKPFARADG